MSFPITRMRRLRRNARNGSLPLRFSRTLGTDRLNQVGPWPRSGAHLVERPRTATSFTAQILLRQIGYRKVAVDETEAQK